jgi:hypothetical protein
MKMPRKIMTLSTLILAATAFFASEANKRYSSNYVGTIYYGLSKTTASPAIPGCGSNSIFFTGSGIGHMRSNPALATQTAYGFKFGVGIITLYY